MAGVVRVLDDALADQIAAGEVVERPASVVRELLDNARDAGARNITVEIRDGGVSLVRVTDDGHGMLRDDAALAVQRHATSKIRTREDLERIATLGFRGEALPSIASVARFRLRTRTADDIEGTEVSIEGGTAREVRPAGCAPGTTIEVRDLFFNVPARRKFLKAKATESAHITEAVTQAALAQPELRLTLLRDGRAVREFLPAADWAERAQEVAAPTPLLRIEGERTRVEVRAMLAAPEHARSGTAGLHVFVNGRPVRDRALSRSISYAYGSVIPPGRYPVGVVRLTLDPAEVDVNVHPQKAEVRFRNAREVHDAVTRVVASGLGTAAWRGPAQRGPGYWEQRLSPGPQLTAHPERPSVAPAQGVSERSADPWGLSGEPAPTTAAPTSGAALGAANTALPEHARSDALPFASKSKLVAVAQVRRLFILADGPDGLVVLDQHAADERVKYHALRGQYARREVPVQRLLLPERVELSETDAALVGEHAEQLTAAGLEAHLLGPTTAAVHTVPALLRRAKPERLLQDLLEELSRRGERGFGDAIDMALATMACHGAIRAGDALSLSECQALLDTLEGIGEFSGHCPHGRPVLTTLAWRDLEHKVGR